jgi:hypothetical protein
MSKKYQVSVFTDNDLYLVLIADNLIIRVTKFMGDSQIGREVSFNSLPVDVQEKIIEIVTAQ